MQASECRQTRLPVAFLKIQETSFEHREEKNVSKQSKIRATK